MQKLMTKYYIATSVFRCRLSTGALSIALSALKGASDSAPKSGLYLTFASLWNRCFADTNYPNPTATSYAILPCKFWPLLFLENSWCIDKKKSINIVTYLVLVKDFNFSIWIKIELFQISFKYLKKFIKWVSYSDLFHVTETYMNVRKQRGKPL